MSKFNTGSSYFKRNSQYQFDIISKSSKKEQKKNKKIENNTNKNDNISDNYFNQLIE